MGTPHKHAAIIKAWADGAEIQYYSGGEWLDLQMRHIGWHENSEYRIKPERVFPKSSLTFVELVRLYHPSTKQIAAWAPYESCYRRIADAAVKRYILDQEAGK